MLREKKQLKLHDGFSFGGLFFFFFPVDKGFTFSHFSEHSVNVYFSEVPVKARL